MMSFRNVAGPLLTTEQVVEGLQGLYDVELTMDDLTNPNNWTMIKFYKCVLLSVTRPDDPE